MRQALLLMLTFGLLLAPSALATSEVAITSFTSDKTTVQAGEELTLTIRVKNDGPDAASNVNFNFSNSYALPLYPLSSTVAPGWQCSTFFMTCYTLSMPANTNATLTYRVVAPATYREEPLTISMFGGASEDSNLENNEASLTIALVQSATRLADLSITISAPPNPIAIGAQVMMAYDVRNNGPDDLSDVYAGLHLPLFGPPITVEGAGWTCTSVDGFNATCHRASLAANANAPLSARFTAPAATLPINTQASVFSAQAHVDGNPSNDRAFRALSIGNAADWSRILIPFTTPEVPGANGSLWKTEISGIIEAAAHPETVPSGCGGLEDPCALPPLNRAFDAFSEDLIVKQGRPHFLYYKSSGAKVSLIARVYDASKSDSTAGAFVPLAHGEDFSADGFTLVAIPAASQFRSVLRIYDANGTGGQVEISLYRTYENEPFATRTVTLDAVNPPSPVTTALLPFYPAIAQLDLGALIPKGTTRVRVSVRPLATELPALAMQLWGFVSITNNETSHVTVVTP
jgi:hypothetical protein